MQSPLNQARINSKEKQVTDDQDLLNEFKRCFDNQKMHLKKHFDVIEHQLLEISAYIRQPQFSGQSVVGQQYEFKDTLQEIIDLQKHVSNLYNYLKQNILSFKFFDQKYLPRVNASGFAQKYEFSYLITFLLLFLEFTQNKIEKKYSKFQYFNETKTANIHMMIPKNAQFESLIKTTQNIKFYALEYEENFSKFYEQETNRLDFPISTFKDSIQYLQKEHIVFSLSQQKILGDKFKQTKKDSRYSRTRYNDNTLVNPQKLKHEIIDSIEFDNNIRNYSSNINQNKHKGKWQRENKDEIEIKFHREIQNLNSNHSRRLRSNSQKKNESIQFSLKFEIEIQNDNIIAVKVKKGQEKISNDNISFPAYQPDE